MAKKLNIEKGKKRVKWNLMPKTDFIDGDMLSSCHIEIFGSKKIEIDGCAGVYEYTNDYLKLRLKTGALLICGSDFDIITFENKSITVKGNIKSIEFCV
ncbi:MAG: YabP/YqfC family sporulation protein [Clostridia bacterium]|nr:YabP/YqfC family sporulation protein [Clostridia bacterium]